MIDKRTSIEITLRTGTNIAAIPAYMKSSAAMLMYVYCWNVLSQARIPEIMNEIPLEIKAEKAIDKDIRTARKYHTFQTTGFLNFMINKTIIVPIITPAMI